MWTDFDLHISTPISVMTCSPRRVGSEMFAFDWIGPSSRRGRTMASFASAPFNAGVGGAWRNAEPALGSSARAFSQSDGAGERRVWIYPGELSWELHVLKAILSRRWPTCNFCSVTGFPRCSSSVQYSAHKNTLRSCNERSLRRVKSEGVRNNTLKFWGLLR
jgi:hypothetical protein